MIRDRFTDTFDRFQPSDRGRFGDNESAAISGNDSVRSNLIDLKVYFVRESAKAIAVGRGDRAGPAVWLPKSQVEWEPRHPASGSLIEMTLPQWLAKEKGLT